MSRFLLLATLTLAAAALVAVSVSADQLYGIRGPQTLPDRYFLGYLEDKACFGKVGGSVSVRCDWKVVPAKGGKLIQVEPHPGDKWGGWYLSYDPEGKDRHVFLRPKPEPGSLWHVGRNTHLAKAPFDRFILAAEGKVSGDWLDVGEKAKELKDREGKPYTAYRAVLTAEPKIKPCFYFIEIAP